MPRRDVAADMRDSFGMPLGKREAHKQRTRAALAEAAWALFDERGFDDTSVTAIAQRVGVSERTFYRYFEKKEAVLFEGWESSLEDFVAFVDARPSSEPVVRTLQEFTGAWAVFTQSDLDRARQRQAIVAGSQTVQDYERTRIVVAMRRGVTEALARRLGVDARDDVRPTVLAGLLIEILIAAKGVWVAEGGSLIERVQQAWSALKADAGSADE